MRVPLGVFVAALAALALVACASGGGSPDGGNGGGRDGGRRDAGRRDGGEPTGCDPSGWAAACQMATDLGMVATGETVTSELGLIERRGGAQWAAVHFPSAAVEAPDGGVASMSGGGAPSIRFLRNDGNAYRLEVRTACTSVGTCGGGESEMATNITEWTFSDDPTSSDEGPGQFSTRNAPWPETIYLRVYAAEDPACGRYQVEISR